jgi:hypothetical protein
MWDFGGGNVRKKKKITWKNLGVDGTILRWIWTKYDKRRGPHRSGSIYEHMASYYERHDEPSSFIDS